MTKKHMRTKANKGKQIVDEGANSKDKSDEIQDDGDFDATINSCVPHHLRAKVAQRLHQRRKKKELPLIFVGKKMDESLDLSHTILWAQAFTHLES